MRTGGEYHFLEMQGNINHWHSVSSHSKSTNIEGSLCTGSCAWRDCGCLARSRFLTNVCRMDKGMGMTMGGLE